MDVSKLDFDLYQNTKPVIVLEKIYDDYLIGEHQSYDYRDYSYFHPSDMGVCIRKAYLEKIGHEGEYYTNGRVERTFVNGHSTHARYQEHFSRMGIIYGYWKCLNCLEILGTHEKIGIVKPSTCSYCNSPRMSRPIVDNKSNIIRGPEPLFEYKEIAVQDDELNLRGHVDCVIKLKDHFFVVDFKTASDFAFNKVKEDRVPTASYVFQINIYMYILGIPQGFILYEDSNSKKIKEFFVKQDDAIIEEVKKRLNLAAIAEKTGSIPPIPDTLIPTKTQPCSFYCKGFPGFPPCQFLSMCHPNEHAKLKNNGVLAGFARVK